jgi:hypothetical protein
MESLQSADVAEQLSKLEKLRADGVLTEEEFQKLKTKLIADTIGNAKSIEPTNESASQTKFSEFKSLRANSASATDNDSINWLQFSVKVFAFSVKVFAGVLIGVVGWRILTTPGNIFSNFLSGLHQMDQEESNSDSNAGSSNSVSLEVTSEITMCGGMYGVGGECKTLKILNKGGDITIGSVVINQRATNPDCNIKVDKVLKLGDAWTSEDHEYSCGELVQVDVNTDRGMEHYKLDK